MITAPPGTSQADVDLAELLICSELGLSSLERRKVSQDGWTDSSVISAREGPIVALDTVLFGTTDQYDQIELSTPWRLKLLSRPYGKVRYTLLYKTGWESESDIPAAIKQAVLMTAQARAANPLGVQSERLGDVAVTYGKQSASGLPETALALLGSWRRPRW